MPELVLYYKPTCPFCHKVLRFLKEKNIQVLLKNILEDSTNRQELLKIGGKIQVPCLVIDGKALYESGDIIDWFRKNWNP